ncbi:MAG: hypothetical protein ACI9MJ_000597 [Alphaproteobacteria bacterium]
MSLCGYRLARVRRMIGQYPWLYERNGVFFWRKKGDSGSV